MAKNKQQPGRVKSALLNWLGVPISLTNGEFWREWFGTSSSGKVVTADKVIRLSAVWACVRLLSESVSTLPLKIYERQADGSRKLAQNNPAYQILCRRPKACNGFHLLTAGMSTGLCQLTARRRQWRVWLTVPLMSHGRDSPPGR